MDKPEYALAMDVLEMERTLEALRGTDGKTLLDPLRQSKTVTVFEVNELERYQFGRNMPGVAVSIRCCEE